MTECGIPSLHQCVARSVNQLGEFRNPSRAPVYNPLGCSGWSPVRTAWSISGEMSWRALDSSTRPRPRPRPRSLCVASSSPSPQQEPLQPALETEEPVSRADASNAKSAWVSAMEFTSSLVLDPSEEGAQQAKKKRNRVGERKVYLLAAIASSTGFATMAAGAVFYRFYWQMQGSVVPYAEILGTFSLAVGAAVGMEYWARWAHKALWHDSLWNMHESHHRPREGPFETNDVFAIINAVPAISLMAYGFFNTGLVPGLCFGAGLGITMFGMAYMFVHDGLVHRRFPVGPIADVPYLQKVAAAHQLHHADLFGGVPYGLFLGPQELESVGGEAELQKVLDSKYKSRKE